MSTLKSVCGNREQKLRWRKRTRHKMPENILWSLSLSGANRVFCRTVLKILFIPCTCLCSMSLVNTLLISSLALFWITFPDLQDLLISLGPRPRHNKKHLVWSGDLHRLLSKQDTEQVPLQRTSLHCLGHSLRATLPPPQREIHTEVTQCNCSALCEDEVHKFK